jgi:ClpA/ClpB-like protein
MAKATTVRFTDDVFARLDQASAQTGMPINSIVVAACLEWISRHVDRTHLLAAGPTALMSPAPRWATLRRAVEQAAGRPGRSTSYPFERFTAGGQNLLSLAQAEAVKAGSPYIGTEHLLLAAFQDAKFDSAKILATLGVDAAAARASMERMLGATRSEKRTRMIPTARVKRAIELAFELCSVAGDPRVSTGHLLLALSTEGNGIAARVLTELGATTARIEEALDQVTDLEA